MNVQIDGCNFNNLIDTGLSAKFGTDEEYLPSIALIPNCDDPNLAFIATGVPGPADAYVISPGTMELEGEIETYGNNDPSILSQFRLGFTQNVISYNRYAIYESGYELSEQLVYPTPVRDGEPGEIPFSFNSIPIGKSGTTEIGADDGPKWVIPAQINGANLITTGGTATLCTWLNIARLSQTDVSVRKMQLLAKVLWSVYFNANFAPALNGGQPVFTGVTGEITSVQNLDELLLPNEGYQLGSGMTYPDLRSRVSGNDYRYGIASQNKAQIRQWTYDKETEDAVERKVDPTTGEYINPPDPSDSISWLDGGYEPPPEKIGQ